VPDPWNDPDRKGEAMDDRMMTAVLYDRYGGPEVLCTTRVPRPEPAPGEILVKVHAFSVNGIETTVRNGRLRLLTGRTFPQRIGLDFAGEVAATGAGIVGFVPGDRVWGILGRSSFGSAAEYVTVPAERAGPVPDGPRSGGGGHAAGGHHGGHRAAGQGPAAPR
jgi:NADPH:quinone reductase-like Zn-dependent oxidoreductase